MKLSFIYLLIFLSFAPGKAQSGDGYAEAFLERAKKEYQELKLGKNKTAQGFVKSDLLKIVLKNLDRAIKANPNLAEAFYQRGLVKKEMMLARNHGRSKNADLHEILADFDQAISLNSVYAEAFYERAEGKASLNDSNGFVSKEMNQEAIIDYTKAIELSPNEYNYYHGRAGAKERIGDIQGSLADHTKAIEICEKDFPDIVGSYYGNRANTKKMAGDWKGAETDFTQALEKKFPEKIDGKINTTAYYYKSRGECREKLENYIGAVADYKKYLASPQNDIDSNGIPKEFSSFQGNERKRIESKLKKLVLKKKQQEDKQEIEKYSNIIIENPKDVDAYFERGLLNLKLKNFEEAIKDFSKTVKLDKKKAIAYYQRGLAYREKGDLSKAMKDFSKVIKLDKSMVDAYYERGSVKLEKKQKSGAKSDFKKYLKATNESEDASVQIKRNNIFKDFPKLKK